MKILVVEDAADVAKVLVSALSTDGHEVTTADDGLAAIEAVWRNKPDLVMLDIGLPIVDGLTVLRRLRERGNDVAVIMVTGRVEDADKVEGLTAGADDYICKPFSLIELRARVAAVQRRLGCAENHARNLLREGVRRGRIQRVPGLRPARFLPLFAVGRIWRDR